MPAVEQIYSLTPSRSRFTNAARPLTDTIGAIVVRRSLGDSMPPESAAGVRVRPEAALRALAFNPDIGPVKSGSRSVISNEAGPPTASCRAHAHPVISERALDDAST